MRPNVKCFNLSCCCWAWMKFYQGYYYTVSQKKFFSKQKKVQNVSFLLFKIWKKNILYFLIKFYIRDTLWTMLYITSMYFYNISKNPNFANELSKSMLSIKADLKTPFVKIK